LNYSQCNQTGTTNIVNGIAEECSEELAAVGEILLFKCQETGNLEYTITFLSSIQLSGECEIEGHINARNEVTISPQPPASCTVTSSIREGQEECD